MAEAQTVPAIPRARSLTLGALVSRELDPAEFPRMMAFEPYRSMGKPPNSASSRIFVLEDPVTKDIEGFWVLFVTFHVEPAWLHPKHRKKGGPLRRLWQMVWEGMRQWNASVAYAVIADQDIPGGNLSFANRGGFVKIPGSLYYVTAENAPDLGRVVNLPSEQG